MRGSPALRIRTASAAVALIAGVGLLAYEPATLPASGADDEPLTESAVTLNWSDGIVGADNSTVVEERDPEHYMYDDFAGLELTVAQTDDIRSQALEVSWSGWNQTPGGGGTLPGNFMQFMQCWGNEATGPLPENCVWGARGMPDIFTSYDVRYRQVADDDPLATNVPDRYQDPQGKLSVPFRSANTDELNYTTSDYPYDNFTTNEIQGIRADADGDGAGVFTVHDAVDAPHLGCGVPVEGADGAVDGRDCWLVAVPHGVHKLDGSEIDDSDRNDYADGSPLTPTLWNQRIQVHLDFAPVDGTCPLDAEQRATVGSEMAALAMYSWQPALCADGGATYAYIPAADAEGRRQVSSDIVGSPGMAFTYAPVVADESRPEIVHAPVSASGVAVAFNVEERDGTIIRNMRLTPRLVAKMLTQSYRLDVPGGPQAFRAVDEPPEWVLNNPRHVSEDPEFRELNPDVPVAGLGFAKPNALRIAGPDPADALREVWRWIQADPEAAAWLAGEPDEDGMVVNPYFRELGLDSPPAPDTVPREVERCYLAEDRPEPGYCSLDLLRFANGFEDAAAQARAGRPGSEFGWNPTGARPDNQPGGWWSEVDPQKPGDRWQLALTDTASAERFSLPVAGLRNTAGEFVQPDAAGLTAGMGATVPSDVEGVLEIDPEANAPDAYPLSMLTYAAVRAEQEDEALADYAAMLTYAAGPGQEPGLGAGQLPPGYAPLTEELRAQTLAVAENLATPDDDDPGDTSGLTPDGREDPPADDPSNDESPSDGGSGGDENGGGGDASGGNPGGGDLAGDGVPGGSGAGPEPLAPAADGGAAENGPPPADTPNETAPPPADGEAGGGPDDGAPPAGDDSDPVAQSTPGEPVGPMQYALLAVLIAGLVGALAGPALLQLGPRTSR